jgi:hypothetical protein
LIAGNAAKSIITFKRSVFDENRILRTGFGAHAYWTELATRLDRYSQYSTELLVLRTKPSQGKHFGCIVIGHGYFTHSKMLAPTQMPGPSKHEREYDFRLAAYLAAS